METEAWDPFATYQSVKQFYSVHFSCEAQSDPEVQPEVQPKVYAGLWPEFEPQVWPEVQPEVWLADKKWTTNIFALDSTQALC